MTATWKRKRDLQYTRMSDEGAIENVNSNKISDNNLIQLATMTVKRVGTKEYAGYYKSHNIILLLSSFSIRGGRGGLVVRRSCASLSRTISDGDTEEIDYCIISYSLQ